MTTIKQLFQTSPVKANELFAKLLDTTDGAVKTREKLFGELKTELELASELEEKHLFPVLRKHKETKGLVQDALNGNKQTRKLLAELDGTPKDSEDFTTKVTELRNAFQQHVRDEKKELLPAVLEALSAEESEAVVLNIEERKAEIASAEQAEVEQRRAEARQERKQAQDTQRATEEVANTLRAGAEEVQRMARTTEDAVRSGYAEVSKAAQRTTNQAVELFSEAGEQSQKATQRAVAELKTFNDSSTVLASGYQEVSRQWISMAQQRFQRNMEGVMALSQCRSPQAFIAAQVSLLRDNLELTLENSQRITQLSSGIFDEAKRTISGGLGTATKRTGPAAK